MWFKKKEAEKKIEPKYEWKQLALAIDLANLESLNDAFLKGYSIPQNHYLVDNTSILPREGILVLIKSEKVLIEG